MWRGEGHTGEGRPFIAYGHDMAAALSELNRIAKKFLGETPVWDAINLERIRPTEMRQGRTGDRTRE